MPAFPCKLYQIGMRQTERYILAKWPDKALLIYLKIQFKIQSKYFKETYRGFPVSPQNSRQNFSCMWVFWQV